MLCYNDFKWKIWKSCFNQCNVLERIGKCMRKILKKYLIPTILGAVYFGIVFLFIHVDKVSGISYKISQYDVLNLLNYLFLFPKAYLIINEYYKQTHTIHKDKSNMRKAFEKNGESFAQMQYAPAWSSHGGNDFLFEVIVHFFIYLLTYLLAVLILAVHYVKKAFR